MDQYEMRISDNNGIMGEWKDVNDNHSTSTIFSKYIKSVRYQFKDDVVIEYRIKESNVLHADNGSPERDYDVLTDLELHGGRRSRSA